MKIFLLTILLVAPALASTQHNITVTGRVTKNSHNKYELVDQKEQLTCYTVQQLTLIPIWGSPSALTAIVAQPRARTPVQRDLCLISWLREYAQHRETERSSSDESSAAAPRKRGRLR